MVILLGGAVGARAQSRADTALTVPMFVASGSYELPAADFAKRYGPSPGAAVGLWIKTRRHWVFGFDYTFHFTNKVREGVLDSVALRSGDEPNTMIGSDGLFTDVRITGRGYRLMLTGGRLWPMRLPGAGANAGLMATFGAGFWQHKINFEDVAKSAAPIRDEYVKGYDRLSNGLALTQRVGYLYLSARRRINFYVGLEATEGFTRSRRSWDFSTMQQDTRARFDMLYGVRVGWLFAVYKKLPKEFYYD